MVNNKKVPFWRLSLIFSAITILGLAISYGDIHQRPLHPINATMGDMMGKHLQNVSVKDIINFQNKGEASANAMNTNNHHSKDSILQITHRTTTAVVVGLLPPIIAGTVFLTIIWIRV